MTDINRDGRAKRAKASSARRAGSKPGANPQAELPGWTNGLRQIYDQVVDEDLPDSLRDLLARLDDKN